MAKGHKKTREEKLVEKLIDMLSDLRLDLDMIGLYFGRYASRLAFQRLETVFESAKEQRENHDSREAHYDYIRNI
jgi:chromosome condensin MukBEF MukE localization factor